MRRSPLRSLMTWSLVALAALATARCSDSTSPTTGSDQCSSAADLATCLPAWSEFSPHQDSQNPTPADSTTTTEKTDSLSQIDSTGALVSLGNVTFECTSQQYTFVDNPEQALSFNLDQTVIWPGALVQGKSHRDATGTGDLLELPIRERAPVTVTLNFNNQDNTRTVDSPDQGSVNQALGSMIGNAQAESLATPNNIDFKEDTFSSEEQAAQSFGVSGRYLGFEASAKGSTSKSVSSHVVVAQFKQQMYVAGVTQPATPAAVFSAAFTAQKYQEQASLGRIGSANPPLYVSRIGYGRMMVFSMSANATASQIQGALNAAYKGIAGSAKVSLNARDSAILASSEIRISQVGGDQSNALKAIQSGQLSDYFTNTAPLTSAAPLWFELKTLTGQVAEVSEPGAYTRTTCTPKLPGTFDFRGAQSLAIDFTPGTERYTLQADVNGDRMMDLVFDELSTSPSLNIVHVALANGDGSFSAQPPDTAAVSAPEGWENFTLLTLDMNGDGRADLVWNDLSDTNNVVYAATSNGNGSFAFRPRQDLPATGWNTYRVLAGDLNNDGRGDLIWTDLGYNSSRIRTYFGMARADSSFAMHYQYVDQPGDYTGYETVATAQMDGVGGEDLVINDLNASGNQTHANIFTPTSDTTGTLTLRTLASYTGNGWVPYITRFGNIDGKNGTDAVFVRSTYPGNLNGAIHRLLNNGDGTFTPQSYQTAALSADPLMPYLADFNNDGRDDILLNHRSADTNQVLVGFGTSAGQFTFPSGIQEPSQTPTEGWAVYDVVFVGDVTGDGKADVVWTNPSSATLVYVAVSK
jgi:hypothetical protein